MTVLEKETSVEDLEKVKNVHQNYYTKKYGQQSQLVSMETTEKSQVTKQQDQTYKSSIKILIRCVILGMGSLNMGYNFGVFNLAQPKLNIEYGLEDNLALYKGILGSCLLLGTAIGCLMVGYFIQKYGERRTSIMCDILIIFLVCFYAIPEYYLAVGIRFILGIVLGVNISLVPQFIKNVTPIAMLGKTGSFTSMFMATGALLAVSIGQGFPTDEQKLEEQSGVFWRFVLLFPIMPSLIRLLSVLFIYRFDTPIYYIKNNQDQNAEIALQEIYKKQYVEQELKILKEVAQKQSQEKKASFKQLFQENNRPERKRVEIGFMLQIIQQFSGIVTIMLYSKTIFEKSTGDKELAQYMTIGAVLFQVVPSFISGEITKCFGRRQIILFGYFMIAVNQIILGSITLANKEELEEEELPQGTGIATIAMVFAFCVLFRLTFGTISWTYCSEVLSPGANGIAIFLHFIFAFFIGLVYPVALEEFGIHSLFFFFSFVMLVGFVYFYPRVLETKGLNQKEIIEMFEKKYGTGNCCNNQDNSQNQQNQ